MTLEEAKKKISEEFMQRYYQFINDLTEMENLDFGRKYGFWIPDEFKDKHLKDNQSNIIYFQKNVFSGRWLPIWEKEGFNWSEHLLPMIREGFLSQQQYSNYMARATGKTCFIFISQKTAKDIYKQFKSK